MRRSNCVDAAVSVDMAVSPISNGRFGAFAMPNYREFMEQYPAADFFDVGQVFNLSRQITNLSYKTERANFLPSQVGQVFNLS